MDKIQIRKRSGRICGPSYSGIEGVAEDAYQKVRVDRLQLACSTLNAAGSMRPIRTVEFSW